jgi:hypothetical protein
LLDHFGKFRTLMLPMMQLSFKLHSLLVCIIHDVAVLLKLMDLDLVLLELLISFAFNFSNLRFELCDNLIAALLRILFECCNFVLELDSVLEFAVVLRLQLPLHLCFIFLLLSELVVKDSD